MTRLNANKLEKSITDYLGCAISGASITDIVVMLMGVSSSLWHDLMHAVMVCIKNKRVLDKIDNSEELLMGIKYIKHPNAKYRALKQVQVFFGLLADTFLALEEAVDKEGGK